MCMSHEEDFLFFVFSFEISTLSRSPNTLSVEIKIKTNKTVIDSVRVQSYKMNADCIDQIWFWKNLMRNV